MNVNSLRFLILAAVAALLVTVVIHQPVRQTQTKKRKALSQAFDDPHSRKAWEFKRLADPETGEIPAGIRRAELLFSSKLPVAPSSRDMQFISRGPFNVGGRTRAFAMDVTNANTLIAGSVSGTIYRSTDAGQTWVPSEMPLVQQGITCIAQDTRAGHTNVWYAGSGEAYGQSASAAGAFYTGNGIYKSTDGGMTWDTVANTSTGSGLFFDRAFDLVWTLRTDASRFDSSIVYAATYGGIYRSNTGGQTWKRVLGSFSTSSAFHSYFTHVEVTPTGVVYASLSDDGPNKGIWRSTNGLTFTNIMDTSLTDAYNRIVMTYAPSDENQLYFLANTPGSGQPDTNYVGDVEWNSFWKYTYVGGDGTGLGGAWENRSLNLPTTGGPFDKFAVQGSYDMVVIVKPNDPNYVVIGGTNLYRSSDAFATYNSWRMIGGYKEGTKLHIVEGWENHHPDQHEAFFHPNDFNVLFSGNDGGVFRTDDLNADTVQWVSLNNGYLTTQLYTLALDNATPHDPVIIGGMQDNGTWFTNANTSTNPWVHTRGGDGSYCAIADNKSAYYYSIQNGKMQRAYVDANGNTTSYARIDPRDATGYQFINPYILDPVDNNVMYLPAGRKMWRNNNLSEIPMVNNWDSIMINWVTFPDTCLPTQGEITAVACSKSPAHTVYYGTDRKRVYKVVNANTGNPSRQDITGTTSSVPFPSNAHVNCIAVDPQNADHALVVFSNYSVVSLYATTDGGTTWSRVAGNLEQNPTNGAGSGPSCRWATILHVNDGVLYFVGTSTGLYATNALQAENTVWTKQAPGTIGNTVCEMVISRQSDGLVVVGTHGNGVYAANYNSVNEIAVSVKAVAQPTALSLYPNPSLGENAVLSFYGNKANEAIITVHDVNGKQVYKSLVTTNAGWNRLALHETAALPKGVYFITFERNQRRETMKWIRL